MNRLNAYLIALFTIYKREVIRFMRVWSQTILPPAIQNSLYFIIFGKLVGSQLNMISGYSYMQFIAPGLVMMAILLSSYNNVSFSFFVSRFHRNIEEILVTPTPNFIVLLAFTLGGITRGVLVGAVVFIVAASMTHIPIYHVGMTITVGLLVSAIFSLAGFTNAVIARDFDDINFVPTFVIGPLTYLGGVFYSITQLPPFWQTLSKFNPFLYMVNAFRMSILGVSDVTLGSSLLIICLVIIMLFSLNLYLLKKGIGLKS